MLWLIRLAGLAVLWRISRRRAQSDLVAALNRLSWQDRGRFLQRVALDGSLPLPARLLCVLPALYLLSPIDLVPDFLPFVGHVDDGAIFTLVADLLVRLTPPLAIEKHLHDLTNH